MIRGRRILTAILNDEPPRLRKVNGSLLVDRDIAIVYRFYFYYTIAGKRVEDIYKIMETEFYIGTSTIEKRLAENYDLLKDIKQNAPTRNQLRKRYPHLNWN